jgi:type II secretory pathway pseudopilin PulG
MAGGSSREQNYWPGFVDALTNVVLVMVFVIVVFAISIFGAMVKLSHAQLERNVAERMRQQNQAMQISLQQAQLEVQRQRAIAEQLRQENEQRVSTSATHTPQTSGNASPHRSKSQPAAPVVISGKMPNISVSYAYGVTTLEDKLLNVLDNAIGDFSGAGQWHVVMEATMAEPAPSEARRLAFYRIAVLRDHLVTKGIPPSHIETVILDTPSQDDLSHVSIQIRPPA